MKPMLQIVSFACAIGALSWLGVHSTAGCRSLPPHVADALRSIAVEVCVESDPVSVCLQKCADAEQAAKPVVP